MEKEKIIDDITDIGSDSAGAAVGAGIGIAVAGPAGAVAGSVVSKVFKRIGEEVKERFLSKKENERIETVIDLSRKEIEKKLEDGQTVRDDDFFGEGIDGRSSAEEILEGTLLVSQREYEEMKIPYMAKLYANIVFDKNISRAIANQILKITSEITFRQIVILKVIGLLQKMAVIADIRINQARTSVSGITNVTVASDIYDLYINSLISSKSIIFGAANINPVDLSVSGYGVLIYNLMELDSMNIDNSIAQEVLIFLTGAQSIENK